MLFSLIFFKILGNCCKVFAAYKQVRDSTAFIYQIAGILLSAKGNNSGTNFPKIMCNNPKLDLVNINACIKFGENSSSSSQDIERKQIFGVNKGP